MSGGGNINSESPKAAGLALSTATSGKAIALAWGMPRLPVNVLSYHDFEATQHTQSQSSGKGGGGMNSISYTYKVGLMLGACAGPVAAIPRVFVGKEAGAPGKRNFAVTHGAWDQPIPAELNSSPTLGVDGKLAYRGIAGLVSYKFDLGDSDSMPNINAEVDTGSGFSSTIKDADPSRVLREYLTIAGIPSSYFASLDDWSRWCVAAGLFFSPAYTEREAARDAVNRLMQLTGSAVFLSDGQLKTVVYADAPVTGNGQTWVPNLAPVCDLTYDDFLESDTPVKGIRTSQSDARNLVRVKFSNRAKDYNEDYATASSLAMIQKYGQREEEIDATKEICDPSVAALSAEIIKGRLCYVRMAYEFKLGWKFARLEPGDLVTITVDSLHLDRHLVRITEIVDNEDGEREIKAEEMLVGTATASRAPTQETSGYAVNYNDAPGALNTPVVFEPPLALSGSPQVWIAASGGENWGGADVFVSDDDTTYKRMGRIMGKARHGTLTAALPMGGGIDAAHTLAVDMSACGGLLLGGTEQNALDLMTLCWVDGELLAYRDATLTGINQYSLGWLVRGAYGTAIGSHAAGKSIVRLDADITKIDYDAAKVGKQLYIKLQSFNVHGSGYVELSDVAPIIYTLQGATLADVTGLALEQPFTGPTCKIKWDAVAAADGYTVEVWAGSQQTLRRTAQVGDARRFEFSRDDALAAGGPWRALTLRVRAISATGASGNWATLPVNNPQIPALTGVSLSPGVASLKFACTQPADVDFAGIQIWLSDVSGFAPSVDTLVYEGSACLVSLEKTAAGVALEGGKDYYLRAAGYDVFGKDSVTLSSELVAAPIKFLGEGEINAAIDTAKKEIADRVTPLEAWKEEGIHAADLVGQIQNAQIVNLNANKVLGQIVASQISVPALDAAGNLSGGAADWSKLAPAVQSKITSTESTVGNALSRINAEEVTRAGETTALAGRTTTIEATVGSNQATADTRYNTLVNSDTSLSQRIDSVTAAIGGNDNLLRNSAFEFDLAGWANGWNQNGDAWSGIERDMAAPAWCPTGMHTLGFNRTGTPTGLQDIYSDSFPVTPGKVYGVSAYLANHRCESNIALLFFDSNSNGIAEYHSSSVSAEGGTDLRLWTRAHAFATAPSNAVRVCLFLRAFPSGNSNTYSWMCRPMLEEALPGQTQPSTWREGSASLRAEVKSVEQAYLTANSALSSRIDTQTAQINTDRSNANAGISNAAQAYVGPLGTQTSRVDTLTGSVATAQSTANSAISKADQAQSTADGKASASSVAVLEAAVAKGNTNLMKLQGWRDGQVRTEISGADGWSVNGGWGDAGNVITMTMGPYGEDCLIWRGIGAGGGPDGGWNYFPENNVDGTVMHRLSVWMKPLVGNATLYLGTNGVSDIGGGPNGNPYFSNVPKNSLAIDRWYLFVGYIMQAGWGGGQQQFSGIYDGTTGVKVWNGTDFTFYTNDAAISHRAYQYYGDEGCETLFALPRIDKCDGNEPRLADLLSGATRNVAASSISRLDTVDVAISGKASNSSLLALQSTVAGNKSTSDSQYSTLTTADSALGTQISNVKASLGGNPNLLPNTSFDVGTAGWGLGWNQYGEPNSGLLRDADGDAWRPVGLHTIGFYRSGTPTGVQDIQSDRVSVTPGQRIWGSAYVGNHRCSTHLLVQCFNSAGANIANFGWSEQAYNYSGGTTLGQFSRLSAQGVVPAGTTHCALLFRSEVTGASDPHTWICRPMLEIASAEQTQPSEWNEGTSGMLAGIQSASVAYVTPLATQTGRIDTLNAAVNTAQGTANAANAKADTAQATADGKASSSSVATLTATVGNHYSELTAVASVAADAQGKVNAKLGAVIDVNGHLSGFQSTNNGMVSDFVITADKMLITAAGSALNDDPYFKDQSAWINGTEGVLPSFWKNANDSGVYSYSAACIRSRRAITIVKDKTYKVSWRVLAEATSGGGIYIRLVNTRTTGHFTGLYEGGAPIRDGAWHVFSATASGAAILGGAESDLYQLQIYFNWYGTWAGNTLITDFRIEEQVDSTLIVDGGILARSIATDAIEARHLKTDSLQAKIAAFGSLSALTATLGDVTAGAIHTPNWSKYIDLTGDRDYFLNAENAWIDNDGNLSANGAYFSNVYARGNIEAVTLKANTVMVGTEHLVPSSVTNVWTFEGPGTGVSGTITTNGGKLVVFGSYVHGSNHDITLYRDGVALWAYTLNDGMHTRPTFEVLPAGTYTYALILSRVAAVYSSLVIMELKR